MIILGIETSCDETSVAVCRDTNILANEVYTQSIHSQFGGVVPEIASRAHLQKIDRLASIVLSKAGIALSQVDLVAVADCPGLAGALLVGMTFALGIHAGYGIAVTGINHLEGHICSILIEYGDRLAFPFLALVASGGHTSIYQVHDIGNYACLGQTVDDAAGEAFDKVGKLLGFPYPAGRTIEQSAMQCKTAGVSLPVARLNGASVNFSFSGLKTAAKYYIESKDPRFISENVSCICKGFQEAVVESLMQNVRAACRQTGISTVVIVGGVACNSRLREAINAAHGIQVYFPAPKFCTDNAAMIARAGYERSLRGITRFPRMDPSQQL